MPKSPWPDSVTAFLRTANPATITALRGDGQPVSVATWYLLEDDGRLLVNMDGSRRRLDYLRGDPRVSMTILAADDWYRHVSIQGRVVQLQDDPDLVDIDRLCRHYTGTPFATRDRRRVSARISIERWHAWADG